jgi:hypothetical protein
LDLETALQMPDNVAVTAPAARVQLDGYEFVLPKLVLSHKITEEGGGRQLLVAVDDTMTFVATVLPGKGSDERAKRLIDGAIQSYKGKPGPPRAWRHPSGIKVLNKRIDRPGLFPENPDAWVDLHVAVVEGDLFVFWIVAMAPTVTREELRSTMIGVASGALAKRMQHR